MASKAIPIILCGRTKAIGGPVTQLLKPEAEVIRFIQDMQVGKQEIPILLSGKAVDPTDDDIGSLDFSRPPQAILFGGAFKKADVDELRAAVAEDFLQVPWIMKSPDAGSGQPPAGSDYAAATVKSLKHLLAELQQKDLMGKDGIFYW